MKTLPGGLYDYPTYYDLVFGSDWKAEYDFLMACFERHSDRPIRRVFEPACGTGRLLYRLGRAGWSVSGLDLNPKSVEFCNRRLARHGLPQTCFTGDMTAFRLEQPVDAAFNMINSFRHLVDSRQPAEHFECMAEALTPGGLYVLGFDLTPTEGESLDEESWSARRGHLGVTTHLQSLGRDVKRRVETFRLTCDVYTPTERYRIEERLRFRTYTQRQFKALLKQVGKFELAAAYDFSYDIDAGPIRIDASTQDVVVVLRRV